MNILRGLMQRSISSICFGEPYPIGVPDPSGFAITITTRNRKLVYKRKCNYSFDIIPLYYVLYNYL